jgi:hypothetical protein
MPYRRRPSWLDSSPTTTKVSIHWSSKSSAFAIKFSDTKNWNQMQILIQYLKNIPYGERDYDPETKVWFLIEKYIEPFKEMVSLMNQFFSLDFTPKPTEQTNQAVFIPVDVYLDKFKNLTGHDIKGIEYPVARKQYLRWLMINHPDKKPENHILVRDVNECWSALELNYFKTKKETEYAST